MAEVTYSREDIRNALLEELSKNDFLGNDKERFYTVLGIIGSALDAFDKIKKGDTD